ncbi:MAG: EF-P lysine aminoacylase EpmA [Maricaulaceae bacterium]
MTDAPAPRWLQPETHTDRRPRLRARARALSVVRAWFANRDFVETECGVLQTSPGAETHLHAFETAILSSDRSATRLYLHTSPEFAAKKLLAAGETQIVDIARVFRNAERSALHAPEFTLVEWYRAHSPYEAVIADCLALIAVVGAACGANAFRFRDRVAALDAAPVRISAADAFARFAGIDLLGAVSDTGVGDGAAFKHQAEAAGVACADDDGWSDVFARVLAERVEPNLPTDRPVVLDRYPAPEAALARRSADDPRTAERFEVYLCGVELANGFGELTDAEEQRARLEAAMAEKARLYGGAWPVDAAFLDAVGRMPPASGVALGFDRLVMLATGADHIDQVIWTPTPGPGGYYDGR